MTKANDAKLFFKELERHLGYRGIKNLTECIHITTSSGDFWSHGGRILLHSGVFFVGDDRTIFRFDYLDVPDTKQTRKILIKAYRLKD